jgi:hypothetical protein
VQLCKINVMLMWPDLCHEKECYTLSSKLILLQLLCSNSTL